MKLPGGGRPYHASAVEARCCIPLRVGLHTTEVAGADVRAGILHAWRKIFCFSAAKNSIFSLKIYILRLKIHISKLEIYIFNLETDFYS